jgi:hypothetical protein
MQLRVPGRELRRLLGWVLPILAGLLLAPASARADCGDYVSTSLSRAGKMTAPEHPATPPKPHKPCTGPGCSQAPATPTAPAPTTSSQGVPEWGCALAWIVLMPLDPTAVLHDRDGRQPVRQSRRIFHPPRFVS